MKPMGENSNYMCYAYQMKKEYEEAIKWCKNAIELGNDDALIGLGFSYSKLKNYESAVKWYLKASEKKHPDSMINLGSIYTKMNDNINAEKWFKKAIQKEDLEAYQGISKFYHDNMNDNIKASAYAIALINTKYTIRSVLKLLQKTWNIPNETIQKGYDLQLNSDEFPIKYKGDLGLK
ncbi:MAG: sel1 repeat family protein [Arcobacter sp.]|nr:sel1 repeat family protein [Arcobacter sp.]